MACADHAGDMEGMEVLGPGRVKLLSWQGETPFPEGNIPLAQAAGVEPPLEGSKRCFRVALGDVALQ